MSLNKAIAEAVAGWREYREPCQSYRHLGLREESLLCTPCAGTGYVQPPEVKALIEAVTTSKGHTSCSYVNNSCYECKGTGRAPRDWEEIGDGALEGVLRHWYQSHWTEVKVSELDVSDEVGDSESLAAVDKALKQRYGGKP